MVLIDEDYRIKAIFTQKNGRPVLLDAFAYETCWLDDQRFIHVDREEYDEVEFSLCEFTKDGDYNLVYSILHTKEDVYLTKDGKTEQITTHEEWVELYYGDYCRYSEPFSPNEQTRNVSPLTYTPLTYTPLTEATENLIKAAAGKTWHKYAELEKTTGKDFARENIYITFENPSDTHMKMNVKYAFTFSYPDPDRDHWLLDETTESFLSITGNIENGLLFFDTDGIKGKIEFGHKHIWLIIEESTDQRFPVGNHCYEESSPRQ